MHDSICFRPKWINQILELLTRLEVKEGFLQMPAKEGQKETGEWGQEEGEPGDGEKQKGYI